MASPATNGPRKLAPSVAPSASSPPSRHRQTTRQPRGVLNARAAQLLQRIQTSTVSRDKGIEQLSTTLKGKDDQVDEWIEFLDDVGTRQLTQCKENAATMASRVSTASKQAEDSSRKVKELHEVSGRVQGALSLVRNVIQQRESVNSVNAALDARNFELAGKCIKQYDAVMLTLRGTDLEDFQHQSPTRTTPARNRDENTSATSNNSFDGSTVSGTGDTAEGDQDTTTDASFDTMDEMSTANSMVMVDPDQVMTTARARLEDMVREELSVGTKPDVVTLTKVLADIGKKKAALEIYAQWVKDRTEAEVKEMVDVELLKLSDDSTNKSSHLHIVSQVLDRVVCVIEREEPHVRECFPDGGVSAVIQQLHKVCTGSCDRAIQDFLHKRNIGSSSPQAKGGGRRGGHDSDPRILDGTLEDIAHLIACYHLYLTFVESKLKAKPEDNFTPSEGASGPSNDHSPNPKTAGGGGGIKQAAKTNQQQEVEWLRDPSFSKDIRDLLDIYGSQQKDYLMIVFKRAYERLVANIDQDVQGAGGNGNTGMFSSAFGGLFGKQKDAEGAAAAEGTAVQVQAAAGPSIERHTLNFVDDIFRILLVAVHRSSQTRSVTLTKRTIADITHLISGDLLGTLQRRLQGLQSGGPGTGKSSGRGGVGAAGGSGSASSSPSMPPAASPSTAGGAQAFTSPEATERSLRWADAGLRCSTYITRMAVEIQRTAINSFETPQEREELVEPLKKLRGLTENYDASLKDALRRSAATASEAMIIQADLHTKFVQVHYFELGKEGLDYMALNDPWAHASCQLWTSMLHAYTADLSTENEDSFIQHVVEVMVGQLMGLVMEKEFDQDGGVQLDRDIRAIRDMFANLTQSPIRDKFTQLSQTAAILLVENASDAGDWYGMLPSASKKHLTPQDVASVLQRRRDMTPGMIQQVFR